MQEPSDELLLYLPALAATSDFFSVFAPSDRRDPHSVVSRFGGRRRVRAADIKRVWIFQDRTSVLDIKEQPKLASNAKPTLLARSQGSCQPELAELSTSKC